MKVKKQNAIKGYKVTNSHMTCISKKYKLKKEFHEDKIMLCQSGFHFCEEAVDCFNYYSFNSGNRVFEVIGWGEMNKETDKYVCSDIQFLKEITWNEVLTLVNIGKNNTGHSNSGHSNSGHSNSGHRNSGDRNSGHWNSGHRNSGDRNSGHSNSGHWNSGHSNSGHWNSGHWNSGHSNSGHRNSGHSNSGHWNSGDRNSGHFNTNQPKDIYIFNKMCKREIWDNSIKPEFLYNIILIEWIYFNNMTNEEKEKYPKAYVRNGYLKRYSYNDAWQNAYNNASKNDIELLKKLPNFNIKIFKEITGITVK